MKYVLKSTDKVLSSHKVYCDIDISSRNITKLRINQRKLPHKVFSVEFMCVQPFLILADVFNTQIMASGNLPPQRREVFVRGDGNCFYRAIALWNDEISDEKHEEIHTLSSSLIERIRKVFEPLLFSSRPIKGRKEITRVEKIKFAKKLRKIDPCSGILDFFSVFPKLWWKWKFFFASWL